MVQQMQQSCGEKAGFLFEHACKNPAAGACQRCSKAVCAQHWHPTPQGYLCTSCAKQEAERAKRQQQQYQYDDSPYLYDTYYYYGYGYYGRGYWGHEYLDDDFTEADGEAVESETDGDWEDDMGGS